MSFGPDILMSLTQLREKMPSVHLIRAKEAFNLMCSPQQKAKTNKAAKEKLDKLSTSTYDTALKAMEVVQKFFML